MTSVDDGDGRERGRAAGLRRALVARLKIIASAAIVGGAVLSLAITFSASVGTRFQFALLGESYASFLLGGVVLALVSWRRFNAGMRRLHGAPSNTARLSQNLSSDVANWYAKGSLAPTTDWETPGVAGEED